MSDIYDDEIDQGMIIDLDTEGLDEEAVKKGGGGNLVDAEGMFHVTCNAIERQAEDDKLQQFKLDLQVLNGTVPEQSEKMLYHWLYLESWQDKKKGIKKPLSEASIKSLAKFALAFGLITPADLNKKNTRIPFHLIEGRQAIVKVKKETRKDDSGETQTNYRIPFNDAWHVTDPEVENVPKDAEALSLLRDAGALGDGGGPVDVSDL